MDEENIDVKEGDEQTPSESSTAEETTTEESQAETTDNTDVLADGTPVDQKTVPYKVFQESNEKLAEATRKLEEVTRNMVTNNTGNQANVDPETVQQKEAAKEALKPLLEEMGYVSKDELRRTEADKQLESDFQRLEKTWDGKADPELKFNRKEVIEFAIQNGISNPEHAFKLMKEEAFANYRIRNASSKSAGIKTEGSNGSGSQSVGTTDEDLKEAAARGDKKAKDILLTRISNKAFRGI